jgi:hypothetical protein
MNWCGIGFCCSAGRQPALLPSSSRGTSKEDSMLYLPCTTFHTSPRATFSAQKPPHAPRDRLSKNLQTIRRYVERPNDEPDHFSGSKAAYPRFWHPFSKQPYACSCRCTAPKWLLEYANFSSFFPTIVSHTASAPRIAEAVEASLLALNKLHTSQNDQEPRGAVVTCTCVHVVTCGCFFNWFSTPCLL